MAADQLPIYSILPDLRQVLARQTTAILQAPPGAGKSTILPLELKDESWLQGQKIIMLEPRRLAARSVAARMADLLQEPVGESVGYRIRFEQKISSRTRIEVVTEGILTRMLQHDNALEGVGMLIFDEFHERSLQAELALALSRESQSILRPDLRLLIMSATLAGEELSALLEQAPVLRSEGRQYPITYRYVPQPDQDPLHQQTARVIRQALREESGDVLAFLPGQAEIRRTAELLEELQPEISLHPLFGELSSADQQAALMPHPQGKRKVVLATSIAETSLTIEGVRVVVDSGYSRLPRFDARNGLSRLETLKVSKDTADQRAGRAGRLGPGVAYRLWSEGAHHYLEEQRKPEILEADLAPMVLELSAWGVSDPLSLSWLTPPPAGALSGAKTLLQELDALDESRITETGRKLLEYPTHPRLAHLLEEGRKAGQAALAADLAAVLEERDPLSRHQGADLSLRIEELRRWRAGGRSSAERNVLQRIEKLAAQWRRLLKVKTENGAFADTDLGALLAAAYPERIAKAENAGNSLRYRLASGRWLRLPEHDPLMHAAWLAVASLDAGLKEGKIFLAAPLDEKQLLERAREQEVVRWDEQAGELLARTEKRIGTLVLSSKPLLSLSEEARQQALTAAVRAEGLALLQLPEEADDWRKRVMSLRSWRPEEDWPDVSDEALLNSLESWLSPYLGNIRRREDFKRLDSFSLLKAALPWELQQRIDLLAPEKIEVPTGSQIRLQYFADGASPVLAVRLQEVFGLHDTPRINEGRTPVLMHLLSPGYKPVQVTQDLRSFWQNTYAEVRKEIRGRYPKHHWPEDPWTAEAVRGVKWKA